MRLRHRRRFTSRSVACSEAESYEPIGLLPLTCERYVLYNPATGYNVDSSAPLLISLVSCDDIDDADVDMSANLTKFCSFSLVTEEKVCNLPLATG